MKHLLYLFIVCFSLGLAQDRSVIISGNCLLENETDHSGVAVFFQAISGSAKWNANSHSSGVYFAKMVAGEYVSTQKLMLVK